MKLSLSWPRALAKTKELPGVTAMNPNLDRISSLHLASLSARSFSGSMKSRLEGDAGSSCASSTPKSRKGNLRVNSELSLSFAA